MDTLEREAVTQAEPQNEQEWQPQQPTAEHLWLQRLVGEWAYETSMVTDPDGPDQTFTGTESVRPLGDLWVVAEGRGEMPGGGEAATLITLGYDPQKGRYVSTWIGSMMTHLWVCDGEVDETGTKLTLSAEGPDCHTPGKTTRYRDVIEIEGEDRRTLTAYVQGDDGEWNQMVTSRYRRLK